MSTPTNLPPLAKKQKTATTSKSLREAARKKWLSLSSASDVLLVERLLRESLTSSADSTEQNLTNDALCLLLCQQSRDEEAVEEMAPEKGALSELLPALPACCTHTLCTFYSDSLLMMDL